MESFDQCSRIGKARRMRPLALRVLEQYALEVTGLELVGVFTNLLFKVRVAKGGPYLLRVCRPGWRTDQDLLSEAAWLRALAYDPQVGAPQPVRSRAGNYITSADDPGVGRPHRCMLMSWIPGTLLAKHLSEPNLEKMGTLFARLHNSSLSFVPPPHFTRRRMDSIYARGEADVLFSDSNRAAFTAQALDLFQKVDDQVKAAFRDLYAGPLGLRVIHSDLHHENINLYRGQLHPLDFEDTLWGYPIQDIAMAMQDLWLGVKREEYELYLSAFRRGYEQHVAWPESSPGQIDIFRAGRMLWVSNVMACNEPVYLKEHVERVARVFKAFLDTGRIRKT